MRIQHKYNLKSDYKRTLLQEQEIAFLYVIFYLTLKRNNF